jgi:hypothetical protein
MTDASNHIRNEADYLALWQQQTTAGEERLAEDKKAQNEGAKGLYSRQGQTLTRPDVTAEKERRRDAADRCASFQLALKPGEISASTIR